jgi:Fic family protein
MPDNQKSRVDYNPAQLDSFPLLKEKEKKLVSRLNKEYSLTKLLTATKNINALSIDFIHASAQIEGNTYDQLDTENLLEYGQTAGNKKYSDARMIINLREAFNLVLNLNYELDRKFLFNLHYLICNGELEFSELGSVRNSEVLIGGSSYIPAVGEEYLNSELNYLFTQLNTIEHPIEKAIYAHLNLAYLQFFKDGNKRTARMFQTAVLLKAGLVPLLFNAAQVRVYKESLIAYYETGIWDSYVDWFLNSYADMFDRLAPRTPVPRVMKEKN